jgi:hypothetical protein
MPKPELNPHTLILPAFKIPGTMALKLLQSLEARAQVEVATKAESLLEPGMSLVGADGKPALAVAMCLNKALTGYLHAQAALPTLAEEWAGGSHSADALQGSLTPTSYTIAFMLYMEFGRLIAQRAPDFVQIMDAILVLGMNALHHQLPPYDAYVKSFKAQAKDAADLPILGAQAQFNGRLKVVENVLYQFLHLKELTEPGVDVVGGGSPTALPILTMDGVNALKHMLAVLGATESMRTQGEALVRAELAVTTKTTEQISADFRKKGNA